MNFPKIRTVLLCLAALSLFCSCDEHSRSASDTKIGVILPLTGGAAALGKASLNGMQLAVEEYNERKKADEPKLSLVIEDDQAMPAKGISAFQKLVSSDHVKLILGPLPSGVTLAVAPLANKEGVVILSPGSSAPEVTQAGDYVFRNELSDELGAKKQAEQAFTRLKFRRLALLYVNNDYGVGTIRVFKKEFQRLGGEIVADEPFNPGTTDFRTSLTRIKSSNPDGMSIAFQDDIVNIIKQKAELGMSVPIYTTALFEDPGVLSKLGSLAEGVIYASYGTFDSDSKSGLQAEFARKYQAHFKETPTYFAALGYDAAGIMISALHSCGFDPAKVKEALYETRDYEGVSGRTSFDQNGDVDKPVTLKTVRGGRYVQY
jgi:branched-chain amino acid transport system substrate-binding protein